MTATTNGTAATLDFLRSEFVIKDMARVGLEPWTLYPLGAFKAAGAFGLLIGIAVPPARRCRHGRPRPVLRRCHHGPHPRP